MLERQRVRKETKTSSPSTNILVDHQEQAGRLALALVEGGGRAGERKNNCRPHLDGPGPPTKIKLSSDYHVDGRSRTQSLSLSTFRPSLNQIEVDQHYNNYEDGSSSASISATVSYLL